MKNINKMIRILAIVAGVQLLFIVVAHLGGNSLAQQSKNDLMLVFDTSQVDQLVINAESPNDTNTEKTREVVLHKQGSRWFTASDFPVTAGKVENLLDKLASLKHSLPVTTSSSALKRFKVAEEGYERLVTLKAGDTKLAALFLGSGSGARQSYARNESQTSVYTIKLVSYDIPAKEADWQDKNLLKLSADNITEVTLGKSVFKRNNTSDKKDSVVIWKTDSLPADKMINAKGINDSLSLLASLEFSEVLGKENKPEYGLDKPALTLSLIHDGKERVFQINKLKDSDDYVLKVSERDEYFKIASYTAKALIESIHIEKWLTDTTNS